jgi:hypothetical protein
MTFQPTSDDRFLSIYLALAQYPILSTRIRLRMRAELFVRGIIQMQAFESRVREMAIASQEREGLLNPLEQEPSELWDLRMERIRSLLTDLLFSQNLTFEDFQKILNEVLGEKGVSSPEMLSAYNPELAPQELVFEQALAIERLPPEKRAPFEARLQESKVVLIRNLISDNLRYINIAKEWFRVTDLARIRRRRIGGGRIGGKAAGMLLALRILESIGDHPDFSLKSAESYYVGSDVFYSFMAINHLFRWNDQKYKSEEEMRADYPVIVKDFEQAVFPPEIAERLQGLLLRVGHQSLIVRSSSLLEDNFGTAFAGKYASIFLPNQGTPKENLRALTQAIARVYVSTINPNALLYRRSRGLQDYDERMALLIQTVQGETFGRYFFPMAAGVAFSRNLYRWAPQIRREDGFVRMVWGLGTRAVDRVGNDYPRLIALSHPTLRPSNSPDAIRRYSQQFVDLIDLQENTLQTLPIHEVLNEHYPPLRYVAQVDEDGYFVTLRSNIFDGSPNRLVLTYDELLRRTSFAERMREVLRVLERHYRTPVDMEFTLQLEQLDKGKPKVELTILQCRPQSSLQGVGEIPMPADVPEEKIIFSTHFVVPQGYIQKIKYVVFIVPEEYYKLSSLNNRHELARALGRVNAALADEVFICVGPGRWGSSNSDLGVPIDYGDIYNSQALVELSGKDFGVEPEPSLGTHFFQDLIEAQIYPLGVLLDHPATVFNRSFFYDSRNVVTHWIQIDERLQPALKLIRVEDGFPQHSMQIVMDDEQNRAMAFVVPENAS